MPSLLRSTTKPEAATSMFSGSPELSESNPLYRQYVLDKKTLVAVDICFTEHMEGAGTILTVVLRGGEILLIGLCAQRQQWVSCSWRSHRGSRIKVLIYGKPPECVDLPLIDHHIRAYGDHASELSMKFMKPDREDGLYYRSKN